MRRDPNERSSNGTETETVLVNLFENDDQKKS